MGSPTDGYADRLRQRVRPSKGASRGLSQVASDSASNRMLVSKNCLCTTSAA